MVFATNWEGNDEVYLMNSDGTDVSNLTNDTSANDNQPAFSSDGEITFVKGRMDSGNYVTDIYLMNVGNSD